MTVTRDSAHHASWSKIKVFTGMESERLGKVSY